MNIPGSTKLGAIIEQHQDVLLENWLAGMVSRMIRRDKAAERAHPSRDGKLT